MTTSFKSKVGIVKHALRMFRARIAQLFFPFQFPAGHFYSPITHPAEIEKDKKRIFSIPEKIAGIHLSDDAQLQWLHSMLSVYATQPFSEKPQPNHRYYFDNLHFAQADALALYAFIKLNKPKNIIEVGSGFSSAVMLDTLDTMAPETRPTLHFIEPYPKRLYSLLRNSDKKFYPISVSRIQDVDLTLFDTLHSGDMLFIDSTHVSKTGSDVNFIFFDILPRLKKGVYIHFHDIFYPFEYPYAWVKGKGFGWNENYILRAFLQYNTTFQIEYFGHYILEKNREWVAKHLPLMLKNTGGSIYLRKTS